MYQCRFNKDHKYTNERRQLIHEKCCKDKKNSNKKICPYNPIHIFDVALIERHILGCPTRLKLEKENKRIEDEMIENLKIREINSIEFLKNDENFDKNYRWDSPFIIQENKGNKQNETNENENDNLKKRFGVEDKVFQSSYI